MISQIAGNLHSKAQPLILTPTRLEDNFKKNKVSLKIFETLQEGEKLGKEIIEGKSQYYKVAHYKGIQFSRWWYGEGRVKTVEYLEEDFSNFMKFLDDLLKNLEVDPFCQYAKMAKDVREFIDSILPGLYSLKKTYPDTKEMIAKVDSIILCLCDFKDKTEDYINQKNKGIKLLIKRNTNEL
tara:strand:- start:122 stop:667 length:546 start_codon:yes stop_codon:yes gene_type:complete